MTVCFLKRLVKAYIVSITADFDLQMLVKTDRSFRGTDFVLQGLMKAGRCSASTIDMLQRLVKVQSFSKCCSTAVIACE